MPASHAARTIPDQAASSCTMPSGPVPMPMRVTVRPVRPSRTRSLARMRGILPVGDLRDGARGGGFDRGLVGEALDPPGADLGQAAREDQDRAVEDVGPVRR